MKKLIIVLSISLSIGFAIALASVEGTSTPGETPENGTLSAIAELN